MRADSDPRVGKNTEHRGVPTEAKVMLAKSSDLPRLGGSIYTAL
jgi:hypothetical protein